MEQANPNLHPNQTYKQPLINRLEQAAKWIYSFGSQYLKWDVSPTFLGFWQSRSLALSSEDVKQELVSIPESRVPDSWLSFIR